MVHAGLRRVAAAIVLTGLAVVGAQRISNAIAGPYRVLVDHAEECPPEIGPKRVYYRLKYSSFRDRHHANIWYYSANMTTFISATDNYTATANLASWSARGGWKDNAFNMVFPRPCTSLRTTFPSFWRTAMVAVFNNPDRRCPFPPGFYSANNFSTNTELDRPPAFFYGKYRGTAFIHNTPTNEMVFCMRGFFSIVPKTKQTIPTSR